MKALLLVLGLAASGAVQQDLPRNEGWVTDQAGFLSQADEAALEQRLEAWSQGSGNQLAILTVSSLGDRSLEGLALEVARDWGVGQAGLDNGALILVARDERRIRIEAGTRIEDRLTDLMAGRIIDLVMVPEFRAGRPALGIRRGAEAVMAVIGGDFSAVPQRPSRVRGTGGGLIGALISLFILFAVLGSMRRGGGGRGGGGFVGGLFLGSMLGGRGSGWSGGGFSGGGFGGFGGGGFSGGGASGGW